MPTFDTSVANQYKSDLLTYKNKAEAHTITAAEANTARIIAGNYGSVAKI